MSNSELLLSRKEIIQLQSAMIQEMKELKTKLSELRKKQKKVIEQARQSGFVEGQRKLFEELDSMIYLDESLGTLETLSRNDAYIQLQKRFLGGEKK